jgi:hypothetical protein
VTTWRRFATTNFPRVVLELGLPAATSRPDLRRCPRHGDRVGPVTHMCATCHREAWDAVARRYRDAGKDRQKGATP